MAQYGGKAEAEPKDYLRHHESLEEDEEQQVAAVDAATVTKIFGGVKLSN